MVNHPNRSRRSKEKKAATTLDTQIRTPAQDPTHDHDHDREYKDLLISVQSSFNFATALASEDTNASKLFLTDADPVTMWRLYLEGIPIEERQTHNCHACRNFIKKYGGLVAIKSTGELISAMWNPLASTGFYRKAFLNLNELVCRSRVVSSYYSENSVWGTPVTGDWTHLSIQVGSNRLARPRQTRTPFQEMANDKENFKNVRIALSEFPEALLNEALRLLAQGFLARSERFVGPIKWLRDLHNRPKGKAGKAGDNILWWAVATAPEGYCHPRASVIGPLLSDIKDGLPFHVIKTHFESMVHPSYYQRPQATPTQGNIKVAEQLVAKLAIAPSLERRYARTEDLLGHQIWVPSAKLPEEGEGSGESMPVFGHLMPKAKTKDGQLVRQVETPTQTMTWAKFVSSVLPHADEINLLLRHTYDRFAALTAAVNPDAPPILKWDREGSRNTVSMYTYNRGSPAYQWSLGGVSARVTSVVPYPWLWGSNPMDYLSEGVLLILEGCKDSIKIGSALFPEVLRGELHEVRSTIEAYSKEASLQGREEANACGLIINTVAADCNLRVLRDRAWYSYHIDRWN